MSNVITCTYPKFNNDFIRSLVIMAKELHDQEIINAIT